MRLALITKCHPKNKIEPDSKGIDNILIDGELIFSYSPEIDTMFNPEQRSKIPELFGQIFYTDSVKNYLDSDLKRAFIKDMVINQHS